MESEGLPTCVALDLETTGLDVDQDTIIEIGAVKFQGSEVLGTFQTLVNPYHDLSPFIKRLTGISQANVDHAPPFAAVAADLQQFMGSHPVVGHNIAFDLSFLRKHGLALANESFDTWDLASILLPFNRDYSLAGLVKDMVVDHTQPHRALADAQATYQVFLGMLNKIEDLEPATAASIENIGARAGWPIARFFRQAPSGDGGRPSGLTAGLDFKRLSEDPNRRAHLPKPDGPPGSLDEEQLAALLAPDGAFSRQFAEFEHRPQQLEMMRAVVRAFNEDEHLIVEAGTGVGKSIGYLLPTLVYAAQNHTRVVVSTNTINLQEQLLQKDIPALVDLLEHEGLIEAEVAKAARLKGRANYLCLRRLSTLAKADGLTGDDARLLGKCLVWLKETQQGDRSEINLSGRDAFGWSHISAADANHCPGLQGEGSCFLRAARDKANGAHIIVVNHALLMSDLAMGGGLLPEYSHLIIDEAHRLEEEATKQLGFQVAERALDEFLESLVRNLREVRLLLMVSRMSDPIRQRSEGSIVDLEAEWAGRARKVWEDFWELAGNFISQQSPAGYTSYQLPISRSTRTQPGWSEIEIAWENVDTLLQDGTDRINSVLRSLEPVGAETFDTLDSWENLEAVRGEMSARTEQIKTLKEQMATFFAGPVDADRIDWMTMVEEGMGAGFKPISARKYQVQLQSAPLNVAQHLSERLFDQKSVVVMTSATLGAHGSFDYLRNRTGPPDGPELMVGSPFDYTKAAQLLLPTDMPMPDSRDYQLALGDFLTRLGLALEGHTMVLFTSHSALRSAARSIREALEAENIGVLAQGVDGSPNRIMRDFGEQPRSMILGTSSFWEGVDMPKGQLKALVIAKLPFNVPTDPIFAARSGQYEDPFKEYAVPQAILRLRQGIGRLIRNGDDRGSIIVLDRRLTARSYGKTFIDSLPPCHMVKGPLAEMVGCATRWLDSGSGGV